MSATREDRQSLKDAGRDAEESFGEAPVGQHAWPCEKPHLLQLRVVSGASQKGLKGSFRIGQRSAVRRRR